MTYVMAAQMGPNILVELTLGSNQGNQMRIKGSLTRDFQLQVWFFTKLSLPHAPALPTGAISNCLRKFAKIYVSKC
jgi:hypothetical protein